MTDERVVVSIVGLTPDNDEETVDMDELSKSEDSDIDDDADTEPSDEDSDIDDEPDTEPDSEITEI